MKDIDKKANRGCVFFALYCNIEDVDSTVDFTPRQLNEINFQTAFVYCIRFKAHVPEI